MSLEVIAEHCAGLIPERKAAVNAVDEGLATIARQLEEMRAAYEQDQAEATATPPARADATRNVRAGQAAEMLGRLDRDRPPLEAEGRLRTERFESRG